MLKELFESLFYPQEVGSHPNRTRVGTLEREAYE